VLGCTHVELSKHAIRPATGRPMVGLGFYGPGQKGPEDKQTQKYLFKPGPLRATGFRVGLVT